MTTNEGIDRPSKAQVPPASLIGQPLPIEAFGQLCGQMAGYAFIKIVVDLRDGKIHFINNNTFEYHADYIAEYCLSTPRLELRKRIDEFNKSVYLSPDREFLLGLISLHQREGDKFIALETVEIDNMDQKMLQSFYNTVRDNIDLSIPLLFKPANHTQEAMVNEMNPSELPRVMSHELFATAAFVALNHGAAKGRLRVFKDLNDYKQNFENIEWYDIIVMDKVPDDIPRVAGIINSQHTTPLSHTNVLAHGWQVPNAIQTGIIKTLSEQSLNYEWVDYIVDSQNEKVIIKKIEKPEDALKQPSWQTQAITLEQPEVTRSEIRNLVDLRMSDRFIYGTKAANLGELDHVLLSGSSKLIGYYRIPRPPRENLLPYLAQQLGVDENTDLKESAENFLRKTIKIPRGIALPFGIQQKFLQQSPAIQQCIGKLKMALELKAKEVDSLSIELQQLIRKNRFNDETRDYIDTEIANHLGGVTNFVIRSSSNAEDLEEFSAAGIYESINHVSTAENIFASIKEVWASLVTPRSIRLRAQVGISLDDCYMGVIIQEEVTSDMGGVLVTSNPLSSNDIRNVYINVSTKSVENIVNGTGLPLQYLYNTLEGGGRTMSLGDATEDLPRQKLEVLQRLALAGRLLQSHFSKDYTFGAPADIEWASNGDELFILQLRPYSG